MEIVIATHNQHKLDEIRKMLNIRDVKIMSLADFPQKVFVRENGETFEENSAKKARTVAKVLNVIAVADDSGLCVDALGGKPGVRSARYVAPPVTPERLCGKLLRELDKVPAVKRKAKFVCSVSIALPDGRVRTMTGVCPGSIDRKMKGKKGFGYDPVFIPGGSKKTFAQMGMTQKNRLSHRGKAFKQASAVLPKIYQAFL